MTERPQTDRPRLVPADQLVLPAVQTALAQLRLTDQDAAAARLAERYAWALDNARDPAWALRWIGPELLKCLESLGATPAARAAVSRGEAPPPPPAATAPGLARLRAAHRG